MGWRNLWREGKPQQWEPSADNHQSATTTLETIGIWEEPLITFVCTCEGHTSYMRWRYLRVEP